MIRLARLLRPGGNPLGRGSDRFVEGATVDTWIDREGRGVAARANSTDAAFTAAMVAVCGWLTGLDLLATAQCGLHRALDCRRYRAWARNGSGWTGTGTTADSSEE